MTKLVGYDPRLREEVRPELLMVHAVDRNLNAAFEAIAVARETLVAVTTFYVDGMVEDLERIELDLDEVRTDFLSDAYKDFMANSLPNVSTTPSSTPTTPATTRSQLPDEDEPAQ